MAAVDAGMSSATEEAITNFLFHLGSDKRSEFHSFRTSLLMTLLMGSQRL
jgi:hypothetical protein